MPDLTKKVIGYRTWKLRDGELMPQNEGLSWWKLGVNKAACEKHIFHESVYCEACDSDDECAETKPADHAVPDPDCQCGYYALHDIAGLERRVKGLIGAVAAWGKMEVHHAGFRAEYAQPIAFAYSDEFTLKLHREAGEFARAHGMRYMPKEELEEFAQAFGESVPEELRPTESAEGGYARSGTLRPAGTGNLTFHWTPSIFVQEEPHWLLPTDGELLEKTLFHVTEGIYDKILKGIDTRAAKLLG